MKVQQIALIDIIPYARNPRRNEAGIDMVAASIKEFGFQQPIVVDGEKVIIVGHTRYLASKKLKLETVPVVVATGLSPAQVKAYRIADNKIHEASEWDEELLSIELSELDKISFDMGLFGFSEEELARLKEIDQEIGGGYGDDEEQNDENMGNRNAGNTSPPAWSTSSRSNQPHGRNFRLDMPGR